MKIFCTKKRKPSILRNYHYITIIYHLLKLCCDYLDTLYSQLLSEALNELYEIKYIALLACMHAIVIKLEKVQIFNLYLEAENGYKMMK